MGKIKISLRDMNKNLTYVIGGMVIVGGMIWAGFYLRPAKVEVQSFDDCVKAGYPVLESYPRQCKTPDGKTFTEDIGIETIKIKVYFNNDKLDPEFSCNKVFPVEREIIKTEAIDRAALEELLKGASEKEKSEGFFTSINSGVKIQKLTIEDGTAGVDFDEQLEFQVGGSCRVAAIRAQITQTLKQFPTVQNVIISINGRTEDILQP